jgi:hypothetical protein
VNGRPVPPVVAAGLVMTGGPSAIVMVTVCEPGPPAFEAVTVTGNVPVCVGIPEMSPLASAPRPAGSVPVTAKLVGALLAVIW